jgi:mannose-1-phosphate guanylyltransferase/mannose-6-phosphate isomerase
MVADGRYLWNSGMFLFALGTMRRALARHVPDVVAAARSAVIGQQRDLDFCRLDASFANASDISIDYAVLEREIGTVVPMEAGWNDLGSWRSVWQESTRDAEGVGASGQVTATRDAVLICDLDSAQSVGDAVAVLKRKGARQAEGFLRNERPWGHYETLALGPRFQVKSIVVKPGGKLSLQSHVHRSEHWVVVEGTAIVTVGRTEQLLTENQSVYIPLGEIHRLENRGKVALRLIEVQTGAYLGEDDIVRYEDVYARA